MCYNSEVMVPSCQVTLQTSGSAWPCSIRHTGRDTVGGWGGPLEQALCCWVPGVLGSPWKQGSQQSCGPESDGTPGADERAEAEVGAILAWG